jgi:hypothetical protein
MKKKTYFNSIAKTIAEFVFRDIVLYEKVFYRQMLKNSYFWSVENINAKAFTEEFWSLFVLTVSLDVCLPNS